MVENTSGLSSDFIICPGEIVNDVLTDRNMLQSELAQRTGYTEAYVSQVISGHKRISTQFAKKLEYALGVDAAFWLNLQANHDAELATFNEQYSITEEECDILKLLKEPVKYLRGKGLITAEGDSLCVIELRKILRVGSLTNIPKLTYGGAFRIKSPVSVDVYVLCAWIRLCELATEQIEISSGLDVNKLISKIPEIKALMFAPTENMAQGLQDIFAECGIAFCVMKNFRGAPVQGYIKHRPDGTLLMAMTIRKSFADIFWFTLFHEIGHVINDDLGSADSFVDFLFDGPSEKQADKFAADTLLDPVSYTAFVGYGDYSIESINRYAELQKVKNYIVIGRLQKDGLLDYSHFAAEKIRYKWAE